MAASVLAAACGGGGDSTPTPGADQAPEPKITAPANGAMFRAGEVISYSGAATDAEDGVLPPARLSWRVDLHRGDSVQSVLVGDNADSGTFIVPVQGLGAADFFYRVRLTATDSKGQSSEAVKDIYPLKAEVTLRTDPSALSLMLDGQFVVSPHTFQGVVGSERHLVAADDLLANGTRYRFNAWSDGGASAHTITVQSAASEYTASFAVVGPEVNQPPSVSLPQPAPHDGNVPIHIVAQASDADGAVVQVQLFDGTTLVGTDNEAPFTFDWRPTTAGLHTLTAQAMDNQGAVSISGQRLVEVAADAVTLTVPATVALNTAVLVEVSTSHPDTVTRVDLNDGAGLVGSAVASPFLFNWTPTTLGEHVLKATVTNQQGIASTRQVKVAVQTDPVPQPTLGLVAPATAYQGTSFLLQVNYAPGMAPQDLGISQLQLFEDTEKVATSEAEGPVTWLPKTVGERHLTLRAITIDGGVVTSSKLIPVTVSAPPPALPLPPASAQVVLWAGQSGGQGMFDGGGISGPLHSPLRSCDRCAGQSLRGGQRA
jgi:hypothetical protein